MRRTVGGRRGRPKELACIVCGERPPALDGLCSECLSTRRRFIELPQYTELVRCAHCASVLSGRRWADSVGELEDIEAAVRRELRIDVGEGAKVEAKVKVMPVDEHSADAEVVALVRAGLASLTQTARTRVRLRRSVCERCSRIRGQYYEATLQVRALGRPLSREELALVRSKISELFRPAGREDFIGKEEEVEGGLDLRLGKVAGARALARAVAQAFGGRVSESSSLVGRRDGRSLHRVTFLVRLPGIREGDFVRARGRLLMVMSIGQRGASCRDLASGEERLLDGKDIATAFRVGGREIVREAVVLEERRPEVQILDPVSCRPLTLVAPEWFWRKTGRESVGLVRDEDEVYLVPDERERES
ncbi:MAG: NMD3-related protein [Thermoplasmata archaeon]